MSDRDRSKDKNGGKKKSGRGWALQVFLLAVVLSALLSFFSSTALEGTGYIVAALVLAVFIGLGIVFDMIGVAVTAADPKPFHSMAAHKEKGAREAIRLLRNAGRVSSICNDVVGDICGVVSGSASATIAAQILTHFTFSWPQVVSLVMSALVAALTVGGKAVGKSFAIGSCTTIVQGVGKMIYTWNHLFDFLRKKKETS